MYAKNWHTYIQKFGRIVSFFFFPKNAFTRDLPLGSQWNDYLLGTYITKIELNIILKLILKLFLNIQHSFRPTPFEELVKDICDRRVQSKFSRIR